MIFDLLLFDLDGTLTDSKEGIINCVRHAQKECNIPQSSDQELMRFIGPPLLDSFMEYCNLTKEQAEAAVSKYRERFRDIGIFENEVYPGVLEMLKTLKEHGYKIVLATAKPEIFALRILDHFHLAPYFDDAVGAELEGGRNNKQEVIREVLAHFPDAKAPVMIGDRAQDVCGAAVFGIPCIGVKYGYAEDRELEDAGAFKIVETVSELTEFLTKSS